MNHLIAEQARRNREARDEWDRAAPHRARVTGLLVHAGRAAGRRLCVLGAGNANDLDLGLLATAFDEIHLVDIDADALARGVAQQPASDATKVHLYGGVDVTGVFDLLAAWSPDEAADDEAVERCLREVQTAPPTELPGEMDVVASVCLLTQLIEAVVLTLGQQHGRFLELVQAIRLRHLRLMLELLAPAGRGVLVTDVVSSDTSPDLPDLPEAEFPGAVARLIEQRNFFTGANPFVIESLLKSDPAIAPFVANAQLFRPWPWRLGPRTYAVCAIAFSRGAENA